MTVSSLVFLLQECLLPYLVLIAVCVVYIKQCAINLLVTREKSSKTGRNVLLLTAHPDDECMFFAPTILNLLKEGHNLFLVCLSKGDHYGKGDVRKKELISGCTALGIPARNVSIVDDERFQDGPDNVWDLEALGECILSVVQRVGADSVITFDKYGVSGHPNHIAIFRAVEKLQAANKLKGCLVFSLLSTNLFRKYVSFFDIPLSSILSLTTLVNSPHEVGRSWKAMAAHKSQLVWFRKLFCVFSRYFYVNTLQEVR